MQQAPPKPRCVLHGKGLIGPRNILTRHQGLEQLATSAGLSKKVAATHSQTWQTGKDVQE